MSIQDAELVIFLGVKVMAVGFVFRVLIQLVKRA